MPFPIYAPGSASARFQNHASGFAVYDSIASVQAGDLLVCVVVNTGSGSADAYRPYGFVLYQSPHANMAVFTRVAVGNATAERAVQTDYFGTFYYYRNAVDISTNPIVSLLYAVRDPWTGGDSRIAGAAGSGLNFPILPVEECGRTFYITAVTGDETSPNNPSGMTIHAELTATDTSSNCFQLGSSDSVAAGYSNTFAHTNGAGTELLYAMSIRGTDPALAMEGDNAWLSMAMSEEEAAGGPGATAFWSRGSRRKAR
jgi:hypothetical protein